MSALAAPWWLWGLAVIGAIALVSVLIALLSAYAPRIASVELGSAPVGSRPFIEAVVGVANAPFRYGGRATLLDNGDEIFPAIYDAMAQAQESVNVMAYIWRPGEVTDGALAILVERAQAGVEVRVLLDGFGARKVARRHWRRLEEAGGRIAWFRPLRFGVLPRYHRRNHRRAIVIDGRVGFTGGAAFADVWRGRGQDRDHWRDSMVRVTGPPVRTLQSAFAQLWANTSGEILVGERFYAHEDGGRDAGEPITSYVGVTSSPGGEDHPLRMVFLMSFLAARKRLYLATSYFVPDSSLLAALENRARAGVDVRILLPGDINDAGPVRWAGQRFFERLLEAGVRIFEYRPTMMHAKMVAVDSAWSIVGSANLNRRSWELDEENILGIHDPGFAAALEARFLADLELADEVRYEEWRRRRIWLRVREALAVVVAQQF